MLHTPERESGGNGRERGEQREVKSVKEILQINQDEKRKDHIYGPVDGGWGVGEKCVSAIFPYSL